MLNQFFQSVKLKFHRTNHAGLLHYIKQLELTTVIMKFLEMQKIFNRHKTMMSIQTFHRVPV
jgi:hypothetical protein